MLSVSGSEHHSVQDNTTQGSQWSDRSGLEGETGRSTIMDHADQTWLAPEVWSGPDQLFTGPNEMIPSQPYHYAWRTSCQQKIELYR